MADFIISEPIEFGYSGDIGATYNFKLYLTEDLVNPIFQGSFSAYPNSGDAKITVNTIVENYIGNDSFIITALSRRSQIVDSSVSFTITIFDSLNVELYTEQFRVLNQWLEAKEQTVYNGLLYDYSEYTINNDAPIMVMAYVPESYTLEARQYNSSGTLIATITDVLTGGEGFSKFRYTFSTLFSTGVDYAKIYVIVDSVETLIMRVNKGSKCPRYGLYYFNRYNGLGYLECTEISKLNSTQTFNDFKVNASSTGINKDIFKLNKRNTVNINEQYLVKTYFLTEQEHFNFRDLYSSPKIWVYNFEDGTFDEVLISDTTYEETIFRTDKLISKTITLNRTKNKKRR